MAENASPSLGSYATAVLLTNFIGFIVKMIGYTQQISLKYTVQCAYIYINIYAI